MQEKTASAELQTPQLNMQPVTVTYILGADAAVQADKGASELSRETAALSAYFSAAHACEVSEEAHLDLPNLACQTQCAGAAGEQLAR